MNNIKRKEKEGNTVAATFFGVTISFVVVAVIFLFQNDKLEFIFPKKQETMTTLLDRGETEEVINTITNSSETVQNNDSILFLLGKAWYLSAWQRNENENWKSYAQNPDDWFSGSDVEKSLHYLKRAAESPSSYAEATTLIGVIYMEKGWFDRAKTTLANVLKKDATQRDAYLYYGVVLSRTKQIKAAIQHLERRINYQSDYDFVKNLFYLYLFDEKNYEKAATLGDIFLKTAPKGNSDVPKVTRELHDLLTRFPEYFNDTMTIIKNRPPEFIRRNR